MIRFLRMQREVLRDYLYLTKPVIVALLLTTTFGSLVLGYGEWPPAALIGWTLLGGALSAGGASAINQYIDRDRDFLMQRTRNRPLPAGRIAPPNALAFGILCSVLGLLILSLSVNPLSAVLAFLGMVYYLLIYSIILKSRTPQNIVLGGGAGAMPVLVGWAAATNGLSIEAFFLFALVFFWTPPHFWALAILKQQDYERAGVPMFPVVYGVERTKSTVMLYSIQLAAFSLLLPLATLGGYFFLFVASALGGLLIYFAWKLWRVGGNRAAWGMYRYSSVYLALIFTALMVDTLVG